MQCEIISKYVYAYWLCYTGCLFIYHWSGLSYVTPTYVFDLHHQRVCYLRLLKRANTYLNCVAILFIKMVQLRQIVRWIQMLYHGYIAYIPYGELIRVILFGIKHKIVTSLYCFYLRINDNLVISSHLGHHLEHHQIHRRIHHRMMVDICRCCQRNASCSGRSPLQFHRNQCRLPQVHSQKFEGMLSLGRKNRQWILVLC